jgi:hypothetical protein
VLADVGGDERVALRDLVELLDHELRLDERRLAVVAQAVLALPFLDLRPPLLERLRSGRCGELSISFAISSSTSAT